MTVKAKQSRRCAGDTRRCAGDTRLCRHELHHEKAVRKFLKGQDVFVSVSIVRSLNVSEITPVSL